MITFREIDHPRGQVANAGQFRTAANTSPAGHLTRPSHPFSEQQVELAKSSYLAAALWSSSDEDGAALDLRYGANDVSDELSRAADEDLHAFLAANAEVIERVLQPGYGLSNVGHDLWLTRNGHGGGFWDRGLEDDGVILANAARTLSEVDLYMGDDGKVYAV